MKTVLEPEDIQTIAKEVVKMLKPLLTNKGNKADDTILDVNTLSEYLKVSTKWIYERTHLNEIPYMKMGGHLRFSKKDIDKWLISFKIPAVNTTERILKACEEPSRVLRKTLKGPWHALEST